MNEFAHKNLRLEEIDNVKVWELLFPKAARKARSAKPPRAHRLSGAAAEIANRFRDAQYRANRAVDWVTKTQAYHDHDQIHKASDRLADELKRLTAKLECMPVDQEFIIFFIGTPRHSHLTSDVLQYLWVLAQRRRSRRP